MCDLGGDNHIARARHRAVSTVRRATAIKTELPWWHERENWEQRDFQRDPPTEDEGGVSLGRALANAREMSRLPVLGKEGTGGNRSRPLLLRLRVQRRSARGGT